MPRKRMIDPSIWTDEGMAELTPRQQLLYIGLLSNADDDGRLKGSGASIRLILPGIYGGVAATEIEADLGAVLREMGQLVAYEQDGRRYLAFRNYRRWQRIDKPSPSILPAPPEDSTTIRRVFDESSENGLGAVAEPSTTVRLGVPPSIEEEKLVEENPPGVAAAAAFAATAAPPSRAAGKKSTGPPLGPLVDAFTAQHLPAPSFAGAEAKAAQALLAHYDPTLVARCWQDHADGSYGDDFARRDLSFSYLANRQRITNWQRWDTQGRAPPATARGGGYRSIGTQHYVTSDPNLRPEPGVEDDYWHADGTRKGT